MNVSFFLNRVKNKRFQRIWTAVSARLISRVTGMKQYSLDAESLRQKKHRRTSRLGKFSGVFCMRDLAVLNRKQLSAYRVIDHIAHDHADDLGRHLRPDDALHAEQRVHHEQQRDVQHQLPDRRQRERDAPSTALRKDAPLNCSPYCGLYALKTERYFTNTIQEKYSSLRNILLFHITRNQCYHVCETRCINSS